MKFSHLTEASKQASRNPLLHRLLSLIELLSVLAELSFGLPGPSWPSWDLVIYLLCRFNLIIIVSFVFLWLLSILSYLRPNFWHLNLDHLWIQGVLYTLLLYQLVIRGFSFGYCCYFTARTLQQWTLDIVHWFFDDFRARSGPSSYLQEYLAFLQRQNRQSCKLHEDLSFVSPQKNMYTKNVKCSALCECLYCKNSCHHMSFN